MLPLRTRVTTLRPFTRLDKILGTLTVSFQALESQIGEQILQAITDKTALEEFIGPDKSPTEKQAEELKALELRHILLKRELVLAQKSLPQILIQIGYTIMALNFLLPPVVAWLVWICYIWRRNKRMKPKPA